MDLLVTAFVLLGVLVFEPGNEKINAYCREASSHKPAWFHPSRYKKIEVEETFESQKECWDYYKDDRDEIPLQ